MMQFNRDELFILTMYEADSPKNSTRKMKEILPFISDPDMKDLISGTIKKLAEVTEEEYQDLIFEL